MRSFRAPSVVPLPVAGLHLGALSALAVAQPLFDLISKNPDFLVARALIGWQVVALGLVLVLVPPLLALGLEALAGLASRTLRAVLHLFFVALFVALIAIQALKDIAPGAGSAVLILIAASLGARGGRRLRARERAALLRHGALARARRSSSRSSSSSRR